jgi:hypothetical protein
MSLQQWRYEQAGRLHPHQRAADAGRHRLGAFVPPPQPTSPERFDVRILRPEETPHLYGREGRPYLRKGGMSTWHHADLQSFSPLRRMVPQLMGFQGRALVTDPDVFSFNGDVL